MRHGIRWLLVAGTLMAAMAQHCLGGSSAKAEQAADLKQRFLREAPLKWEAYREYAMRLQGVKTVTTYDSTQTSGRFRERLVSQAKHRGPWSLSIFEESGDSLAQGVPAGLARVVNSRYGFVLTRKQPADPWVLTELDTNISDNRSIEPSERKEAVLYTFCLHLVVERRLISDMIKDPEFKLGSLTTVLRDSREFVRVEFSHRPPRSRDEAPNLTGWLLLDPGSYWVIKEGEFEAQYPASTGTITLVNQYVDNNQGIPIPIQRVGYARYSGFGGMRVETSVSKCAFYEDANLPESEFTLSAFGLPEPDGLRPTPWYLWAGVAGAACVAVAFGLRWLARKRTIQG